MVIARQESIDLGAPIKLIGIEEHFLTAGVRSAWEEMGLAATDPSAGIHSVEIERHVCLISPTSVSR
jgi:hypothetical protein